MFREKIRREKINKNHVSFFFNKIVSFYFKTKKRLGSRLPLGLPQPKIKIIFLGETSPYLMMVRRRLSRALCEKLRITRGIKKIVGSLGDRISINRDDVSRIWKASRITVKLPRGERTIKANFQKKFHLHFHQFGFLDHQNLRVRVIVKANIVVVLGGDHDSEEK